MNAKKISWIYSASLLGILGWLGAIWLAPYLRSRGAPLGKFIYLCFSPICHQIPARSFSFVGYPLAVCARCLGIYFGFLAGMVLYPFVRGFSTVRLPKARVFLAFTAPIVVDTVANFFHLWETSNVLRLSLGFLWGSLLPFYFMTGLAELALKGIKHIE